mgnify:CR=1 FL=1
MRKKHIFLFLMVCIGLSFAFIVALIGYSYTSFVDVMSSSDMQPIYTKSDSDSLIDNFELLPSISYGEDVFRYDYVRVEPGSRVELINNFNSQLKSHEIAEQYNCQNLVNGGFYTKDNKPLGGYYDSSGWVREFNQNPLIDGVVFFKNGEVVSGDWALQTGPLLVYERLATVLKIKDDKYARRIVAAKHKNGDVYLFAIVGDDSVYVGPLLADLPSVMLEIADEMDLEWQNVVNLDGGSASAFIGDDFSLLERTWIGSALCVL